MKILKPLVGTLFSCCICRSLFLSIQANASGWEVNWKVVLFLVINLQLVLVGVGSGAIIRWGQYSVAAQHEEVSFSLERVDQIDFSVCVLF